MYSFISFGSSKKNEENNTYSKMCDEVSKSLEFTFYTMENLCNIAKGKLNPWGDIDTSREVRRAKVREAKVALLKMKELGKTKCGLRTGADRSEYDEFAAKYNCLADDLEDFEPDVNRHIHHSHLMTSPLRRISLYTAPCLRVISGIL